MAETEHEKKEEFIHEKSSSSQMGIMDSAGGLGVYCPVSWRVQCRYSRDLEFTVVGDGEIPEELRNTIEQKKTSPFKLTYSDDQGLYIVTGYGEQESGGYSIVVEELYLTENSIVFDTELRGPESAESTGSEKSYPYIVVKTEVLENPVVFQ